MTVDETTAAVFSRIRRDETQMPCWGLPLVTNLREPLRRHRSGTRPENHLSPNSTYRHGLSRSGHRPSATKGSQPWTSQHSPASSAQSTRNGTRGRRPIRRLSGIFSTPIRCTGRPLPVPTTRWTRLRTGSAISWSLPEGRRVARLRRQETQPGPRNRSRGRGAPSQHVTVHLVPIPVSSSSAASAAATGEGPKHSGAEPRLLHDVGRSQSVRGLVSQ